MLYRKKIQYLLFVKAIAMLQSNFSGFILKTGTDKADRGCLAGPVTAAAVILPECFKKTILNDSKQLSEKVRENLRPIIEERVIYFSVSHQEPIVIEEINLLTAFIKAM